MHLTWPIQSWFLPRLSILHVEVDEGFDLSPMRGEDDVAILIGMRSSMDCPHTELVP